MNGHTPAYNTVGDPDTVGHELLAELADDLARRYRRGERPSIEEYAEKHPALAAQIRELFPAMLAMEQSGVGPTRDASTGPERVGGTVGRYKLLERIGEGGFGVVYMAEQQYPIRRKVALKVIKAGMDTKQVIARFEAERQALTMMDHPSIAKVLDAGTTDAGRPYFVMELVKGVPITEYCDRERLTTRERLELFIAVCHAVQHAHQKGIIHRDLKPSNVLVTQHDDRPTPKVIDFGVAKAAGHVLTEKTLFTNYAQLVGTPLYMSPEQAQASGQDVDTRSDVYSLGVLLYELLTGTTPFEGRRLREAAYDEMRRIIREEDPPNPSTRLSTMGDAIASVSALRHTEPKKLSQTVRGELDWIVMKALEKERARRYETANGLARDVERHLCDEPVAACPPSARYRLRKFVRKHGVSLAVVGGFILLLVTATVVSSALALRARRAEALAQSRLVAETDARRRALAEAAKAAAISDLLQQALRSANPDDVKGAEYTVRQLLDDLSQRLGGQLNDQPLARAAIHATIGNAYRNLGQLKEAEPHLVAARDIQRRVLGPNHPDVAQALLDHSFNAFESGNLDAAVAEAREALAILQRARVKDQRILRAYAQLAFHVGEQGRLAEAQSLADQAFAAAAEAGITEHETLAKILHDRVADKLRAGQLAGINELAARAVAMHRRVNGDHHPQTAWAIEIQGVALRETGNLPAAEARLREALAIFRQHYQESHKSIAFTVDELRRVLQARGDTAGLAALEADRVVRANEALDRHPSDLQLAIQLADMLRVSGNLEGAMAKYDDVMRRRTPDAPRQVVEAMIDGYTRIAATLYQQKQKLPEAARAYRNAIELREPVERAAPEVRLKQSNAYNDLAFCLLPTNAADAERAARRALDLKAALVAEFPRNIEYRYHLAHTYHGLGIILGRAGDRDAALAQTRKAAEVLDAAADDVIAGDVAAARPEWLPQEIGKTFWLVGDRLVQLGDYAGAEALSRHAIDIFSRLERAKASEANVRQEKAMSYRKLAEAYDARGQVREALTHFETARAIYGELIVALPKSYRYRQELADTTWSVGNLLARDGRWEEAIREVRAAFELHKKAAADFPDQPVLREREQAVGVRLATLLLEHGDYEEAAAMIAKPDFNPVGWDSARACASGLATAVERAEHDDRLDDRRRAALVAAWAPQVARFIDSAVRKCPATSAGDLNGLAWQLAASDGPLSRHPQALRAAVELAEKAVALEPSNGMIVNTLGVARYRAGQYEQAVADLEKSVALRRGGDGVDFFFLAMAYWRLGHLDQGRAWYDRAVAWMDQKSPKDQDLQRFRVEATQLLGVPNPPRAASVRAATAPSP